MPSNINAQAGNSTYITALIKSGASDANLAFETNGIDAVVINGSQIANFVSTGAVTIPRGTIAQRPSPGVNGMFRYNTNFANCEVYLNGSWDNVTAVLTPINSVAPVVSGNPVVGSTLTVTNGTWNNSPTSYSYQWLANTVAITSNATSNTFVLTSTQNGANISCNVIAINASGTTNIATTSNSVGPVTSQYSVSYLVVAGGGGGQGIGSGGGGAGGMLTGTANLTPSTVYTIVIGGGGGQGSNSNITGSGLTSIIAIGGGAGGLTGAGSSGGSGGGSGSQNGGSGGSGTAGQGNAGGVGFGNGTNFGAGGGGGAGGVGGNFRTSPNGGGNGGIGLQSSITGTATYYAGGGGGAADSNGGSGGAGGGGGSNSSGAANTGGGGGGYFGGGGSGVVILSVPTASYSGITTGSPTVTTSGSNTIITFNSSGTYTA